MAGTKRLGKITSKEAFEQAMKHVAVLYREEGASERAFLALGRAFVAAVRMAEEEMPGAQLSLMGGGGVALHRDGYARVLVLASYLGAYAAEGFPLPAGVRKADLMVIGMDLEAEVMWLVRPLGRALGRFNSVIALGPDPLKAGGRCAVVDIREKLRGIAEAIAAHKGPANLVQDMCWRTGNAFDLALYRELTGFWRDFRRGTVAL